MHFQPFYGMEMLCDIRLVLQLINTNFIFIWM